MANERNNRPVSAQWLHMLNSSHIQSKLDQSPRLKALMTAGRKPEETVKQMYLTILSRPPTADELETALGYQTGYTKKATDWVDIAWSLINSTEFLYRH
jgi:hypothetical protein